MSIGRIILYALLIWFLYNLVFKFIVPIYRTSKRVKKQFGEMREKMNEQMGQQQGYARPNTAQPAQKPSAPKPKGDYIDFEEIK